MSFFALLFFFQFFEHFSDFFASIVLQNQKFHGRKFIFPLFIFLFLFSCFLSFLSLLVFCQGDLIAEDKTRHQEKWVEATKENALAGDFSWFGSNSVFLVIEWLVCDTDSPRYTRKWMLIIISLCPLSLSLHFYSPHVYPPSSTRG